MVKPAAMPMMCHKRESFQAGYIVPSSMLQTMLCDVDGLATAFTKGLSSPTDKHALLHTRTIAQSPD